MTDAARFVDFTDEELRAELRRRAKARYGASPKQREYSQLRKRLPISQMEKRWWIKPTYCLEHLQDELRRFSGDEESYLYLVGKGPAPRWMGGCVTAEEPN